MEVQSEIAGQDAQASAEIQEGKTEPMAKKSRFFPDLAIVLVFSLAAAIGFYLYRDWQGKKLFSRERASVVTPSVSSVPQVPLVTQKIALVKNGDIYSVDLDGQGMRKVFETEQEEIVTPEELLMKFSPDGRYLAYVGTSDGLDSPIKVIDAKQEKKIFQDVYGSAFISDFTWAPNSRKIAVAVNLKNNEQDFTTTIYLIDPFIKDEPIEPLFAPENMEITQIEWPISERLYYSRVSYDQGSLGMAGIVFLEMETKARKAKNLSYWGSPSFWFAFSPGKDKIFFYCFPSFEPKPDPFMEVLFSSSLEIVPAKEKVNFSGDPLGVEWIGHYLVGILSPFGSPDQHVALYNLDDNQVEYPYLLDMGPSGSFHSINLVEKDGKTILVVWSEFDEEDSISAYNLDQLREQRNKPPNLAEPLWELERASSPGL